MLSPSGPRGRGTSGRWLRVQAVPILHWDNNHGLVRRCDALDFSKGPFTRAIRCQHRRLPSPCAEAFGGKRRSLPSRAFEVWRRAARKLFWWKGFARLCDRVAASGIFVNLEFVSGLGACRIWEDAWAIVPWRPIGANSGLMIDTWALCKGQVGFGSVAHNSGRAPSCSFNWADGFAPDSAARH